MSPRIGGVSFTPPRGTGGQAPALRDNEKARAKLAFIDPTKSILLEWARPNRGWP